MKKYLVLAVIASAALPALAGDPPAKESASGCGFDCCNMCPLAQQANTHSAAQSRDYVDGPWKVGLGLMFTGVVVPRLALRLFGRSEGAG